MSILFSGRKIRTLTIVSAIVTAISLQIGIYQGDGISTLTVHGAGKGTYSSAGMLPAGDYEGLPSLNRRKAVESDYVPQVLRSKGVNQTQVTHGYYYEHLNSDRTKKLYDAMYLSAQRENRYPYGNKLPEEIPEDQAVEDGFLFYIGQTTFLNSYTLVEEVNEAVEALCYDHMTNVEFYMCEPNIFEYYHDGEFRAYVIMQASNSDDYDSIDLLIRSRAKNIAGEIRSKGYVNASNTGVTVLNVHDFFARKVDYGYKHGGGYFDYAHTAYGALYEEKAVCDGYAIGYTLVLKELGIECKIVTGGAYYGNIFRGGHAWNMVKLEGQWYEEDLTWDDDNRFGNINHVFYNLTTAQFESMDQNINRHVRETPFTGRYIETASGTKYTYPYTSQFITTLYLQNVTLRVGESCALSPQVNPAGTSVKYELPPNQGVVTLSGNVLTAKNAGSTSICVSTQDDRYFYTASVYVMPSEAKENAKNSSKESEAELVQTTKELGSKTGSVEYKLGADKSLSVTDFDNDVNEVEIPDSVKISGVVYPVTSIADGAFKGKTKLKTLKGGKNLTKVGKDAFSDCKNLKTVDLSGAKIKQFGKNAFKGCKKLNTLKINADTLSKIGSKALKNTGKKLKITIYAKNKSMYNKAVSKLSKAGNKKAKFRYKKKNHK